MQNFEPTVYARGFLLAPDLEPSIANLGHFVVHNLGSKVLHVDEIVDVAIGREGEDWAAVIGTVFPLSTGVVGPGASNVANDLLRITSGDLGWAGLEEAMYDLGGRYVLILQVRGETRVYGDAVGTRSIFFDTQRGLVSSHYDMLRHLTGTVDGYKQSLSEVSPQLLWHWTPDPNICALLPNFYLALPERKVARYYPVVENPAAALSHDERIEMFIQLWMEQIHSMTSLGRPLALSMSGGLDSRTTLALTGDYRDKFVSMTYTTQKAIDGVGAEGKWGQDMEDDYLLVKALERFLPARHHYIARRPNKWSIEHAETLDRNSLANHGRWILPGYKELFGDRSTIHLRGNLFELGRHYMKGDLKGPSGRDSVRKIVKFQSRKHADLGIPFVELAEKAMDILQYDEISNEYDLADMWYWEVRHGRWYSQVLSETDAVFDSVTPLNSRRLLDLMVAYPPEERKAGFFQRELIYRAHPFLLFLGFNEHTDLYRQFVRPTLMSSGEGAK